MVKLDRYIGIHVFLAILTVLGIIVGLALLFAFIDELGDVQGNYGLGDALQYVLLTSPRRLYDMLPMAALIGCLIGLGTLASSSELTIMRAAGVSLGRIVLSVMKPMLVLLVAGILIGEYVAPLTEDIAQARRSLAQGAGEAQSSKRGLWHRQENEFVHVNAVQPGGVLVGVTRYRFDEERRLLSSSFARRASYQGDHWRLENIATTHFRGDHTEVAPVEPGLLDAADEAVDARDHAVQHRLDAVDQAVGRLERQIADGGGQQAPDRLDRLVGAFEGVRGRVAEAHHALDGALHARCGVGLQVEEHRRGGRARRRPAVPARRRGPRAGPAGQRGGHRGRSAQYRLSAARGAGGGVIARRRCAQLASNRRIYEGR